MKCHKCGKTGIKYEKIEKVKKCPYCGKGWCKKYPIKDSETVFTMELSDYIPFKE